MTVNSKHCSEVINLQKRWLLLIAIVVVLALIALVDEIRDPVLGALRAGGGQTWAALEAGWTSIASTPMYQSYHMLIWFAGGCVVTYGIVRLYTKSKIPFLKPKDASQQTMMGPPQTVIIQPAQPVSTKAQPQEPHQPEQQQDQANS